MLALTVIAIMKWNLSRRFYGNAVRTSPVKFEFSDVNFRISLPIQMGKIIYRKQDGYSSLLSSSLLTRLFVYFYVSQWNLFYKIYIRTHLFHLWKNLLNVFFVLFTRNICVYRLSGWNGLEIDLLSFAIFETFCQFHSSFIQTALSMSLPKIVPKSFSLNALNHHLLRDMIMDD